ncbi:hypothetical protein TWF506_008083 [Arthrobotrys conoides]|uniref:SCP domain-containing protein n=1 Tax=Arthrobotrys conoides TaxID=74498 RepID=A0AAN8NNQ7_9PEZI
MRFSTIISVGLAVTSALAVPVQQAEGKSSTVQYERDIIKRSSFRELLHKRKQCNKGKNRTSTIDSSTSTLALASYETSPTPASYEVSTDYTAPNETAGVEKMVDQGTIARLPQPRMMGLLRVVVLDTSPSKSPSYEDDTPIDTPATYLTMPAGSSTGLERGSSVRNVGADGTFMSESAIKPYLLAAHNIVRALHEGAGSITWDSSIAKLAQENTPTCDFQHTSSAKRKGLGENISYNTNASPEDQALRQWYANEVVNYNFNNPSNSDGVIGHMTAMVWKDVKSFGCAVRNCGSHGMGLYLKCNYSPVPNIIGRYDQQVGRVKGASTEAQIRKIVEAATGFAPR